MLLFNPKKRLFLIFFVYNAYICTKNFGYINKILLFINLLYTYPRKTDHTLLFLISKSDIFCSYKRNI